MMLQRWIVGLVSLFFVAVMWTDATSWKREQAGKPPKYLRLFLSQLRIDYEASSLID
jgi:hypothetical protein